jgi:hypothetical protein
MVHDLGISPLAEGIELAGDAKQLEEKDPELGVGRVMTNLILQRLEGAFGIAVANGLLGECQ